jgi:hypothetical protein
VNVRSATPTITFDRNSAYTWRLVNGDGSTFPLSTFNIANNASTAVATFTDAGNLGLGVTPSASTIPTLQFGANAIVTSTNSSYFAANATFNSGWKYITSSLNATQYQQTNGQHVFYTAGLGTAGNAITFTQAMTLDASGNLLVGSTTSSGERLQVTGTAKMGTHSTTGYSLVVQNNGANDVSGIRISTGATVDGYLSLAYDATNTYGSIQAGDNNVFRNIVINRQGGSVGIGANPNNSAVLQADSTTRGFLPPRMTTTQRNAIPTPAAGLIVYDTTDNKHYGYNGTTWNAFY